MWHLLKSELLRFRALAIAFAVAHLAILRGVTGLSELFAPSMAKLALAVLSYSLLGLLFGLYQIGSYKRLNQWTYLIHRPLAPKRIFLALSGAATVLFAAVVALPLAVMTFYADHLNSQWVDARHYLVPLFVLGIVVSFYLIGCFTMLSASRAALLVIALPPFFLNRQVDGWWVLLVQAVAVAYLAYLAYAAFKPDLSAHLRKPAAIAASALPIQYSLFWVLFVVGAISWSTTVAFREQGLKGYAAHSWDNYFPPGSVEYLGYRDGTEALAHGLRQLDTAGGEHLRKQLELAEVFSIRPQIGRRARRHQPMWLDRALALTDGEHEIQWTFSHDRMLFHGRHLRTGAFAGWLGTGGRLGAGDERAAARFEAVPFAIADRYLVTPRRLYEFDTKRQQVALRFEVAAGERLVTALAHHRSFVTVLSDHALYLFEPRDFDHPGPVAPVSSVAVPGAFDSLSRVAIAALIDSYLISFDFTAHTGRGFHPARQVMVELGVDGDLEVIAEQALAQGAPALLRHRGLVASPALQVLHDLAWAAIAPQRAGRITAADLVAHPPPPAMVAAAALVALLSAALTAWSARRRALAPAERRAWTAASLLLGAPCYLSFLFLTARGEVVRARPAGAERGVPVEGLVNSAGWSA